MSSSSAADANNNDTLFTDTSDECVICLTPFQDGGETIELTPCGHVYHLDCIKEQLKHAQPQYSKRLLFSGTRCAKCGVFCDHEKLQHLTRRTNELRTKIDTMIIEQLKNDYPDDDDDDDNSNINEKERQSLLLEQGRRNYAFYLCCSCHDPYFGGTVECADAFQDDEGELPSNDRLCPSCAPQPQSINCSNPVSHRGFHLWKCRYCCQPANHVCYATTHFCQSCHDKNSERVRRQQQHQQLRRRRHGSNTPPPPPLDPIPCPGGAKCPFPKPSGENFHSNGSSSSCEQVYYCSCCQSSDAARHAINTVEPGSRNLIINPSGQQGLSGWRQLSRHHSTWQVENPSEIPVNEDTSSNFVSNFNWCIMMQSVPLYRFVRLPSNVRLEVSAKYFGRTDCPSVFRMEAIVINRNQREIQRLSTPELDAPTDYWEKATLVLEPPINGAHELIMIVYGKDKRFWRGNFGSKVADCSVRVLCSDEEELQSIMIHPNNNAPLPQLADGRGQRGLRNYQEGETSWFRKYLFELALPLFIVIFLWLLRD